jgi:hypothetical protein
VQLSVLALLCTPYFKQQIELCFSPTTAVSRGAHQEKNDGEQAKGLEWEDISNEVVEPRVIGHRLCIIYMWIQELFEALDFEGNGHINLQTTGPVIYKVLSAMKVTQLWDIMGKALENEHIVTPDKVPYIVFLWMGINEHFEIIHQHRAYIHSGAGSRC